MNLIKEDGTGRPDANSYASVAEGDAYHEGHLYGTAWTSADLPKKQAALVMATRLIDSIYNFRGLKSQGAQALQWPRTGVLIRDTGIDFDANVVPVPLIDATIETARALMVADRTADPAGQGIQTLTEFNVRSTTYNPGDRRPIIPPVAQAMLARLGTNGESRSSVVPVVRT